MRIKTATERLPWPTPKPLVQTASHFTRVKKKRARPAEVGALASVIEKSVTELKKKFQNSKTHNTISDIQR